MIEFLVASLIITFLASVVFATFSQGMRVWHRTRKAQPVVDLEFFAEQIQQDLNNVRPSERLRFSGDTDEMSFLTLENVPRKEPARIRYRFDRSQKKWTKRRSGFIDWWMDKDEVSESEKGFGQNIVSSVMEYYTFDQNLKAYTWKTSWKNTCPPVAVKLNAIYAQAGQNKKYLRIFPIPAGQCPQMAA